MSRFVSGGTDEQPTQRDDAWLKAQQELDAAAIARQDAGKQAGGKSLYETLQANKAAKQEAFEESTRLTNQFRSLDEDEIEFLDSVQEGVRAREAAVKKDTKEHLDEFRRQQEEAEKAAREQSSVEEPAAVGESWAAGPRKRKKGKEREAIGGLKIRRTESGEKRGEPEEKKAEENANEMGVADTATKEEIKTKPTASTTPPTATASPAAGLGLGAYSSDED